MNPVIVSPFSTLKNQAQDDDGYAWALFCNLTMPIYDSGVPIKTANVAAARIMQTWFEIDITKHRLYHTHMHKAPYDECPALKNAYNHFLMIKKMTLGE